MKLILLLFLLYSALVHADTLKEFSDKLNKSLPEVYDSVTKLERTAVEGDYLVYHFKVDLTQELFNEHISKMQNIAKSNSCKNKNTRFVLEKLKKPILYKYENIKGQTLGQFSIKARKC